MPRSTTADRPPAKPSATATQTGLARLEDREKHPLVVGIEQRMPAILQMLPAGMDANRFSAVVLQAIVKNPDLLGCTPESVIAAVVEAAQDGLEPTGARGGAHLVKFGNEAVLIRDYRGVIRIIVQSGAAKRVEAHEVRRGDHFELRFGVDEPVDHRPLIPNPDGEVLGYYALFTLPDGGKQAEFMDLTQIEAVRGQSRAKDSLGWTKFPGQMARKTVIKRGANYLNLRPEIRDRLMREDEAEYGDAGIIVSRVPSDLTERRAAIAERTARLTGGTEQPAPAELATPPASAGTKQPAQEATAPKAKGSGPSPVEQPPAPAPKAEAKALEDAQAAVHAAAVERGLLEDLPADETSPAYEAALVAHWKVIDGWAVEAIPDVKPADLTARDLVFLRDRIVAGDFDGAKA